MQDLVASGMPEQQGLNVLKEWSVDVQRYAVFEIANEGLVPWIGDF